MSTNHLACRFEEEPRIRDQSRKGKARIVHTVLTAYQVCCNERTIGPGQHVIVEAVDFTECGAHLSGLHQETAWNRRKREVALLEIDALLAKRNKEVGTSVWIDNSLERNLRFMHLQCRIGT